MKTRRQSLRGLMSLFACFLILNTLPAALAADSYTYDKNGNMVKDSGKGQCYQYNDANKLKKVTNCQGTTVAEYGYDYSGRKIKVVENGITTYYPFPDYEEKVYPDGHTEKSKYIRANGEIVARVDTDGSGNTKTFYYHGDHLSSTSVLTDSSGNIVERTSYLPFGNLKAGGSKSGNYLYTGKELDSKVKLYDYGARNYDPELMRFIQPDTVVQDVYDPQSLNRYAYVKNNPVKYVDSSGHYIESALDIAFISMDLNDINNDPGNLWNYGALVADVGCLALPLATGGGLAVRAVEHGGDVIKLVEHVNDAEKAGKGAKAAIVEANRIAGKEGEKIVQDKLENQVGRELTKSEKQVTIGKGSRVDFSMTSEAHEVNNINWNAKSYQTEYGFNNRLNSVENQISRYKGNLGEKPLNLHITKPTSIERQNTIADMCTRNEVKLNWLERN